MLLVIGFSYVLRQKYVYNIQDDNDSIKAIEKQLKEKYTTVYPYGRGTEDDPYYFKVRKNEKEGIFDGQGKEIIPLKYDEILQIDWYYDPEEIAELRRLLGLQKNKPHNPKDDKSTAQLKTRFYWFRVKLDGKVGACDSTGRLIIPPVYENLDRYHHGEYHTEFKGIEFRINLNDPEGVANEIYNNGQEYERALETLAQALKTKDTTLESKRREDLKRIRNMYKPEPLKVPEWFGEEIKTPKKIKKVSQKNSKKSTNVQQAKESLDTKTNSQTKDNNGLLYSGIFTISGECYSYETKKYTDMGADTFVDVKIYNDYIIIKNSLGEEQRYNYFETRNEWRCYRKIDTDLVLLERIQYETYIVKSNFDMAKVLEYYKNYKKESTVFYPMDKGRKKMLRHNNN